MEQATKPTPSDVTAADTSPLRRIFAAELAHARAAKTPPGRFARLKLLAKQMAAMDETLREILRQQEQEVLDYYVEHETSRMSDAVTGATVFTQRQAWARANPDAEDADVIEGLRAAGLGDYLRTGFNTNTLSAHFRAALRAAADEGRIITPENIEDELLPRELHGLIRLTIDPRIRVNF